MFTKFLLLEALVVAAMVGTFVHQQLPATSLTVGETTVVIKDPEAEEAFTTDVPKEVASVATLPTLPATPIERRGELSFPVSGFGTGAVISVFGDRRGNRRLHQGIDIKAPRGTPVVAVADGFVERIQDGGSGGRQLYLRDGQGRLFYYAHLDGWSVEEFAAVKAGDTLGTVGNTGNASATLPHLHFEVLLGKTRKAIDPLHFWPQA